MNGSLIIWTVLAISIFWSVGLYNRLMRMRARGLDALGSVEKYMRRCVSLVDGHLSGLGATGHLGPTRNPSGEFLGNWEPIVKSLQAMESTLKDARAAPLEIVPLQRLGDAFAEVQDEWLRLCEQPSDLAGPAVPEVLQFSWNANALKANAACGGFNQIMSKYNDARSQFPALLVVGLMRFERAGLIRDHHEPT